MGNLKHSTLAAALVLASAVTSVKAASVYDTAILNDHPVMFLGMDTPGAGSQADLSGNGHSGTYVGGAPALATLPNGDKAADFNGSSQYLTVPAAAALSVPGTGVTVIESWIKPDTLQFPHSEAEQYVYWLGKGNPSSGYEYANRMYSLVNTAGRPNRISTYDWNTSGGLGSGGYFQDTVTTTQWMMVTDVINMKTGSISIYKNGALREKVALSQYSVTPGTTNSPFNVGTRNQNSWFQGAVGKVAVYNYALTDAQIASHYTAMTTGVLPPPPPPTASAPVITNVAASALAQTSATIGWTTDKASLSQVEYGATASYGLTSAQSSVAGVSHSVALTGMTAGTVYHYRVKSLVSASGLTGVSADNTFTTAASGTTPPPPPPPTAGAPVVSNVSAVASASGVSISWTTDKISHSQVEYGLTSAYGTLSYESGATGTSHNLVLSGLTSGTAYHYRVKSLDASGNVGLSGDLTFTTTGGVTPPPPPPTPTPTPTAGISNVKASPSSSGATVTWNTTTASHSQVEYGLTASYGSLSYESVATGTSHNLVLTGLKGGSLHHYRVKSLDASGQTAVSGDFTFTTTGSVTSTGK